MAAHLYGSLRPKSEYYHRTSNITHEEYEKKLSESCTVYVGNLSFFTREESIYELFSRCGEIKSIKMGLNKNEKKPCGFCFVEYTTHEFACYAVDCLNGTQLDERQIRIDWDIGFSEGRQFGRGKSGGQNRDEHRKYDDLGRVLTKKPFNPEEHQQHLRDFSRDDRSRQNFQNTSRGDYQNRSRGDFQRKRFDDRNERNFSRDYKKKERDERDEERNFSRDSKKKERNERDEERNFSRDSKKKERDERDEKNRNSDSDLEERNYRRKKIRE